MSNLNNNNENLTQYTAVFQTKKIRMLRGAAQRIFGLTANTFVTIDPSDFNITNTYSYDKLIDIRCSHSFFMDDTSNPHNGANGGNEQEFIIEIRESVGKRSEVMKFRCQHRPDLLTSLVRLKALSETNNNSIKLVMASRHKRDGSIVATFLVSKHCFQLIHFFLFFLFFIFFLKQSFYL